MEIIFIIGRMLFGVLMLIGGLTHFTQLKKMTAMAQMNKVPMPSLGVIGTGVLLIAGGLSFIIWYYVWWGTLLLIIFFVPTTFMMHAFWRAQPEDKMRQTHAFMGNMSIIGLLLTILSLI